MACVDGVIYANASYKHMVAIKFDNQTRQIKLKILGSDFSRNIMFTERSYWYYVESFGELYDINMLCHNDIEEISGIEVFKWDFSRKLWVEVENLDGRLIFLTTNRNHVSCLTDTNNRGNKIYFMKWKDEHIYVYDLEEGTISNLLPCPNLQTPWYKPFWLMPEYPQTNNHENMKPDDNICPALEQHTEVGVEVQSPRDVEISDDQYPPNFNLDILTEVAKNLEPLVYLEYRATCRMFRSAAPSIQRSITSIINELESPWLVTKRHNKSHFSLSDPKYNKNYFMKVSESLQGTLISSSKDGYLLMVKGKNIFCFNPFTRMQVKLPTASTFDNRLSFSSSPSASDCLAVKIKIVNFNDPVVRSLPLGEDDWYMDYLEGYEQSFNAKEPGVFHEGKFYFLGEKGNLGVLKIEDRISWEIIVKDAPPITFYHAYLMKCNGELMAVFVGRYGNWVKVYMLQCTPSENAPSKMIWKWNRVKTLGTYTLFISNISSIAAIARSPGMENKVYFSRFYGQHIVYYSLQTEKFHTHGSNVVLDNFVDTKEQLYSTWIYPQLEIS